MITWIYFVKCMIKKKRHDMYQLKTHNVLLHLISTLINCQTVLMAFNGIYNLATPVADYGSFGRRCHSTCFTHTRPQALFFFDFCVLFGIVLSFFSLPLRCHQDGGCCDQQVKCRQAYLRIYSGFVVTLSGDSWTSLWTSPRWPIREVVPAQINCEIHFLATLLPASLCRRGV